MNAETTSALDQSRYVYDIVLTDAEDKAIHTIAISAQEWIDNAVHERCRLAMEEIVNNHVNNYT